VYTNGGIWFPTKTKLYLRFNWFIIIIISFIICWLVTFTTKIPSIYHGLKNNESRLNHHLSGLVLDSLAWTGHLVHVAIPASRVHIGWDNFLTPPHQLV
jgi:photosystem I P700 chlorophyll a apoprotein A2